MATLGILPEKPSPPRGRAALHAVPDAPGVPRGRRSGRIRHRRKAHRRAHQAPAPEEIDGPGRAWPPHRPLRQLPLAARDWPRRAHPAQPGPHRHGLLQGPQLLLRAGAADPVPHPSRQGPRAPAPVRRRRPVPTSSSRSATWFPTASSTPTSPSSCPRSPAASRSSHQHFGCEFLYVLSGALTIRHGAAIHRIEQGDAIYFDAVHHAQLRVLRRRRPRPR